MVSHDHSPNNRRVVEHAKQSLRPLAVYLGVRTNLVRYPVSSGRWRYINQFGLARTGSNPSAPEQDALHKRADEAWKSLLDCEEIQAMVARLASVGVSVRRGSTGDVCGSFELVFIEADPVRMDELKSLVEEEAGLRDNAARAQAEQKLQRWLRQNYHHDWKHYREIEPTEREHPFVDAFR